MKKVEKLTASHKTKRVEYAKQMRKEKWRAVLFSDEKTFQLGAGEEYAWQESGDRDIREYVNHAPKLNVWGAIGAYVKTPLYFFEENMNSKLYCTVLEERLQEENLIYAPDTPKYVRGKWKFLQDGARAHTAKASIAMIKELIGKKRLHKHPAKSPDLNIIENEWSYLDRKVKESKITSIQSLKRKLKKLWNERSWEDVRKSVDSMPRRLQECEQCGGNRLDY